MRLSGLYCTKFGLKKNGGNKTLETKSMDLPETPLSDLKPAMDYKQSFNSMESLV